MRKILFLSIGLLLITTNSYALNLSRVKTWSSGEILTADDLNAEFNNITNHAIANADVSATAAILASKLDQSVAGAIGATTPNTGAFTTLSSTQGTNLSTSSGNVGIGWTSPAAKLNLRGAGTGTGLALLFEDNAGTDRVVILDNGNVGIGTTNPLNSLIIASGNVGIGNTNPAALLEVGGISKFGGIINTDNNYISGDGGAEGISIDDNGNVGIGKTSPAALIDIKSAGSGTNNTLRIQDSAGTDKVVILDNGNVGIGCTSPSSKLEIGGSNIIFEGSTVDGVETTISITDPTVSDKTVTIPNANSVTLPSGAVFFMVTGNCPAGTTDVSATYSDKFIRVNATGGSTGGADTHTHTTPNHQHASNLGAGVARSNAAFPTTAVGTVNETGIDKTLCDTTAGTGITYYPIKTGTDNSGNGTTGSGDNVPAYLTCKMCQVD